MASGAAARSRVRQGNYVTRGLDEHVALIKQQLDRSMQDGEMRQLAVKIVSGQYDYARDPRTGQSVPIIRAFGRQFRAPEGRPCRARDEICEIERIWDFCVLNVRYVYDPADIDTFATARETLLAGGGDCDDGCILFCTLLGFVGFRCIARVISTTEAPEAWVHIYPMVGMDKDNPRRWVPLDWTVDGAVPGWEYPDIAAHRDYEMV